MSNSTKPVALGIEPSFGFGDRLGCATPGHLDSLIKAGGPIRGIFAQQSIREMARTQRQPNDVMSAAVEALTVAKFADPWGADADHLKTPEDVDRTADAGFTFFTIDPSDHVDPKADDYDQTQLEEKYAAISQVPWAGEYLGKTLQVENGPKIEFTEETVKRAAVKYGKAIAHAIELGRYIQQAAEKRNQPFEIELSVDETEQPTTIAEHYIIADRMREAGVKLVSLAPRFIGEMEKGVDYKGDITALELSMREHTAIAKALGPYKLSLHSGSDKLSMYTVFARATQGLFHVKTAGTSYLEAVRVAAIHDPALFRKIIDFGRERYDTDKATYHVSATVAGVPGPADVADDKKLEQLYLECWEDVPQGKGFTNPGRQILHCTFGSVLTDKTLGTALKQLLAAEPATYTRVLSEHFVKHLEALTAGM